MMANRKKNREDRQDKNISINSNLSSVDVESKKKGKKRFLDDESSSDDERNDIADIVRLKEISKVKRKVDKVYQHLSIDNGIYDGAVKKKLVREGQGTCSINNGEEYYSGSWKDDKPDGYGYNSKNYASTIYHGKFKNGILEEGYGKVQLSDEYEYEGKIKDGNFHGLGSLSIKVSGLAEINRSGIEKDIFKLVAEWKEGKTELVYMNDIEQYYKNQYEIFYNSLKSLISLNNENQQKQRQNLQNFVDLFEKHLSNLDLLKEIVNNPILPRKLKSSADLLLKLDNSYTNLKKYTNIIEKSFNDCVKDICLIGLKIYARRLARSDVDNKCDRISSKSIFDDNLNSFINKSQLSDLKKVLVLNPLVVDLIRKLIRFANERLIQVSSQYRSQFINIQTTFLKSIWMDYFQSLKYDSIPNRSDYEIDEKYHFYIDCYSNLIELSLINYFEIEINLTKLEVNHKNNSVTVKLNGKIVFNKRKQDSNQSLNVIVLDGETGTLKSERSFDIHIDNNQSSNLVNFIENETDPNDILVIVVSHDAINNITTEKKNFLKQLGSTEIEKLKENIDWLFIAKKNAGKINENVSSGTQEQLVIKQNFRLKLSQDNVIEDNSIKDDIESIVYKAMRFSLNNLKPWKNFQMKECVSYFNQHIRQDISTKEIGDKLLIRILYNSENKIVNFLETNKNVVDIKQFCSHLERMVDYYRKTLLKDKNLNYQSKMNDIKKIINYFLQISGNENSQIKDIIDLQLKSIRAFIEAKNSVTEIIDHFLNFNLALWNLSQSFDTLFSPNIHSQFNRKASDIISLLKDIFNMILKEYGVSNKLENKLYAMQKINNFLTNLGALDMTWFVEHAKIENLDLSLFEKVGNNNVYKVLYIKEAEKQVKDPCPHYVLEAILELLKMIKDAKIINRATPTEMIKLRAELIMAIEKSFKYFNDQIKYNSLETFKEDCVVPFKDVIEDNESYQTFCDKLERIDLYFLYSRKLKEITLDQALDLFQQKNGNLPEIEIIKNAFLEYEKVFQTYFSGVINGKISIKKITKETEKQANEWNFERKPIPSIIAGLSVILSLKVSDFIAKNCKGEYVLKIKSNKNYLLQPHCIQILGVLMILDINESTNSIPPNNLAEILTGQGKSWALALLAAFFSLTGYQVTVACYSDYLSQRDKNDFKKNFDPFDFTTNVQYKTFKAMCDDKIFSKNKTLRNLVSDIVSGKELFPTYSQESEKQKSILLVDEVDVFFSDNFGTMYRPGTPINNKCLAEIQKDIWKNLMTGNFDKTQLKTLANESIAKSHSQDNMLSCFKKSGILENHLEEMLNTAIEIYEDMKNQNILKEDYKLIDNNIHVKDSDGKYVSDTFHGYKNSFYYLKLKYEKEESFEQVQLNKNDFGYLLIGCGTISYSELPNSYDRIFGVSGSLKDLTSAEESLLVYYEIGKRSYYPSFFGHSKLIFNQNEHFLIRKDKKDWFDSIVTQARKKIAEDRSVLIFFHSEELLDEFYNSYSGDLGVIPFFITQNKIFDGKKEKKYSDFDVNKLIKDEYAGHHGKITLLNKAFGRGVDFQSEAKVNEKGGMHVIQTFFSMNVKEEIQIKGRTARKDERGSYELILCLEHLKEHDFEGSKNTTYEELYKQRREKTDSFCQNKLKQIEKNKESHNRTLLFFEKALTECNESNREDFITEIMQLES